tara:strand:+ start:3753 stop:5762 length:2010 start_codon:yes stop_codon:yes gene_type:complete
MDPSTLKILQGAAGAAGAEKLGVEDVFKTCVYKGNATARSINTGVDLSGSEDGIVWIKKLTGSTGNNVADHMLFTRTFYSSGDSLFMYNSPNKASGLNYGSNGLSSFNNNGFSIGSGTRENTSGADYVSWTFKKKEKFLDIVTWEKTGSDGSARTLNHSLGSTPGFIMLKQYNGSENWICWHRSLSTNQFWKLNSKDAVNTDANASVNSVSATQFVVGSDNNKVGQYIAFIFAHEEAEFGPDGTQSIISCGKYNGTGNAGDNKISLPFEPGWLLLKQIESDTDPNMGRPQIQDNMRGWAVNGTSSVTAERDKVVDVDKNDNQWTWPQSDPLADGFLLQVGGSSGINVSGKSYMYVAIAAETGKTMNPENITAGTNVFSMDAAGSAGSPAFDSSHVVDMVLMKKPANQQDWRLSARLIEGKRVYPNNTSSEDSDSDSTFPYQNGVFQNYDSPYMAWMFKRHAGFDVVTYKATGVAGLQINHNLGVVPEMIWCKRRDGSARDWMVYHKGLNGGTNPEQYHLVLNTSSAEVDSANRWNDTAPTASVVTLGSSQVTNDTGTSNFIMMLFASISGISAVGSYTGVSGQLQIRNLGFTPRFLLVKRRDGTGKWVVFDTTRGWGSGDDKKIFLTDLAQTNQDVGDPVSSGGGGFDFYSGNDDFNNTGKEYIYYAHA